MQMIFSFFFIAPGLLFKLRCLIFAVVVSECSASSAAGKASASDSRLVISFFDGRLRFLLEGLDFSIRERRVECLMIRLSFLDVEKAFCALGWVWRMGLDATDFDLRARERTIDRLPVVEA